MTAAELIKDLCSRGVKFESEGETLWLEPRSAIPDEVLEEVRHKKLELLRILSSPGKILPFRCKRKADG